MQSIGRTAQLALLSLLMLATPARSQDTSKPPLFARESSQVGMNNTNGSTLSFKILQLADLHLTGDPSYRCRNAPSTLANGGVLCTEALTTEFVNALLDLEQPDWRQRRDDRKIPFAAVFGNHDDENGFPREEIMEMLMEKNYSYAQRGPTTVDGVGNYRLSVHAPTSGVWGQAGSPVLQMYFLDSGAYPDRRRYPDMQSTYDWIKPSQVAYYRELSLAAQNGSSSPSSTPDPALMFFHIPLQEYNFDASETSFTSGDRNERVASSDVSSELFSALVERNEVKATFVGHDHVNDYCFNRQSIQLCYGGGAGLGQAYGGENFARRARVIEWSVNSNNERTIRSWKRLHGNLDQRYGEQVLFPTATTAAGSLRLTSAASVTQQFSLAYVAVVIAASAWLTGYGLLFELLTYLLMDVKQSVRQAEQKNGDAARSDGGRCAPTRVSACAVAQWLVCRLEARAGDANVPAQAARVDPREPDQDPRPGQRVRDYDYTLCHYTEELQHLIYSMAREYLVRCPRAMTHLKGIDSYVHAVNLPYLSFVLLSQVNKLRYPEGISVLQYDPSFAVRGLTIDTEKGLLCKISSHQKLSISSVFRGRQRLSRDEIMKLYEGSRHVSVHHRDNKMEPLNDLFSLAHACLFADVVQYLLEADIEYEPIAIVEDVRDAISQVHVSGMMHKAVAQDLEKYIEPNPMLLPLLERIRKSGKKMFICTNSSFPYIDAGLKYMIGDDWRELFDVVAVSARKPNFYTRHRAFRLLEPDIKQVQWQAVRELQPNKVYTQGSLHHLNRLTGWGRNRVLYIGDSLFSDLVEPSRINGWRTGAIIRELEDEIAVQQKPEYQFLAFQISALEELMRKIQNELRNERQSVNHEFVSYLVDIHEELQTTMERMINVNFGSVFRADSYPSQFAFFVQRYVDIYSARLENLLEYPQSHSFYPERVNLPHEQKIRGPSHFV
ncbi:5'-nucleotidase domain-containing protein, partial [Globisporangium splendens]